MHVCTLTLGQTIETSSLSTKSLSASKAKKLNINQGCAICPYSRSVVIDLGDHVKPEFVDIINYAICQAVDEYLGEKATAFFETVGEYHLDEALKRGLINIEANDKPLDTLIKIARYLESVGYMGKIIINKLGENEAFVEMHGVSVTKSSVKMLRAGKQPSHFMTNIMLAALKKLGIGAELKDVKFDEEKRQFREHWKIL